MIKTKNLIKTFQTGGIETKVLRGIDFEAKSGEFIAIMGRSGAGKSTFLYQMSLLDEPTEGDIMIDGKDSAAMTAEEKTGFRLEKFGYVFQDYALLPELTALENVLLPLLMQGRSRQSASELAATALASVGLGDHLHQLPGELSGGEQQRVAIARAVAHSPRILFADEPTANLDRQASARIMEIFTDLHRKGQTIIMITHEDEYAKFAERVIQIDEGRIVSVQLNQ
ncbi:ABC transporter [Candidatus Kaiserbacteria bacterium RIFCSPHIGHO2_01_FULL_51_33]|uniref:ABC transporter n=1 Tax=Candidatus Kaiserbacteria bacterium RIFCSPLOWO2_01_FULL_51_21 TaxID=1798508 RepID=A0A1F6ED78_9BACT|nr:MAG: ABC transporter [Candidatus Kaiserbacteria bacterium RIFCSPHIGHO2_01_FULL_51_33]OGG71557.1 MAG: ABC transporter [Candidatus Kaiserbacteria bacterium RIFCSPLOWO2_01_FULL_51_21]